MGMVRILALVGALAAVIATAAQAGTTPSGDWWGNDLKPKSAMRSGHNDNFNYLKVTERVRSRYVILDGELTIDDPPGCFEEDYPSLNSCKAWAYQDPDALTLHVFHDGRQVFIDELTSTVDDYDKPYLGGVVLYQALPVGDRRQPVQPRKVCLARPNGRPVLPSRLRNQRLARLQHHLQLERESPLVRRLSVLVLAATALFVAAVPVPAAAVTDQTQMQAYIRQMAPLNAKMVKAENRLTAAQLGFINGKVTEEETKAAARAFDRDLRGAYLGMKAVTPPAVLRGPHAGYVLTVKTEYAASQGALEHRSRQMATLRAQWRQEVTFQLRHAGLSVPLWVKSVRWDF